MIRVVVVGVGLASAGCAQLAGIDSTSTKGREMDTLAIQRVSVGSTVVTRDLDLTGLEARYFVTGVTGVTGTQVVAANDGGKPASGTWRADLAAPAPIELTLPADLAATPQLFAFPVQRASIALDLLEHPDATPAPDGAALTVTTPLDIVAAGERFVAYTVGSWTSRELSALVPPNAAAIAATYPFSSATSLSGRPLARITRADSFLVLRYTGAPLTGVAVAPPFDQTGNDAVTTPTMAPVVADQPLDFTIEPLTLQARFTGVRPAVSALSMSYVVTAAPGASVAATSGPALVSGGVATTATGIADKYGNPFAGRGWPAVLQLQATETRSFVVPGSALAVALFAVMNEFVTPAPGLAITEPAPLPITVTLAGKLLLTDGATLARPSDFVEVTFQTETKAYTLYQLELIDLVPNATATGIDEHTVLLATGSGTDRDPTFSLPPELFELGHSYTLRVFTIAGSFPNAATGDFQTRQLPVSQSWVDSAVFTVVAP
jgi:hypothetical protein